MTRPHRLLAVFIAILGIAAPLHAQIPEPKCDWQQFQHHAADLRAARDAARAISENEGNTEVSPEAIKQIQQFKNSLYAALEDYFRCQPPRMPDAHTLQSDLYTRLALPIPPPPKQGFYDEKDRGPWTGLYLADITLTVQTIPDARNLVAVLTQFGIPYGADAELDIFTLENGAWKPTVNFTSEPYKTIAGGFLGFDYKISPPDAKKNWFVVATHINPWPTSCWQDLYIDALRPDQIGMLYELFHKEQNGYVCDDVPPYLRNVTADTFQVRFSIYSADEMALSSVSVMTYKVRDNDVTRIQPVASNPANFADEWLRTDWRDAQDWSAPGHLQDLRRAHKKSGWGDFTALRSCSSAALTEVEFADDALKGGSRYFLVRHSGNIYRMLRVANHHDPSCKGPNRVATIKDR